jgi:hypothetical protein
MSRLCDIKLDSRGFRTDISRRLRDGSHQPSFLAAHSLQIALLHAASDSAARDIRSGGAVPTGGVMSDRCLEDCADYCKLLVEVRTHSIPDSIQEHV